MMEIRIETRLPEEYEARMADADQAFLVAPKSSALICREVILAVLRDFGDGTERWVPPECLALIRQTGFPDTITRNEAAQLIGGAEMLLWRVFVLELQG